jgi:pentapeptide MXKDX repeat protein
MVCLLFLHDFFEIIKVLIELAAKGTMLKNLISKIVQNFKKPNMKKPNMKKPNMKKPNMKKPNMKKPNMKKPNMKKPNMKKPNMDTATAVEMHKDGGISIGKVSGKAGVSTVEIKEYSEEEFFYRETKIEFTKNK